MPSIYLVRVAETEYNVAGKWSGRRVDSPLTSRGVQQASRVAELIAIANPVAIYSSPSPRVVETAQYLGQTVRKHVITVEEFQEIDIGELDGMSVERAQETVAGRRFLEDPTGCVFPGAKETLEESQAAAMRKLNELLASLAPDESIAIYTHGGIMRLILLGVLNLGKELSAFWRLRLGNSAIAHITQRSDGTFELLELMNFGGLLLPMPARIPSRDELPFVRLRELCADDWDDYVRWRLDPEISGPMFAPVDEQRLKLERVRFKPGGKSGEVYRAVEDELECHIGDVRITRADDKDHTGPLTPHGVWSFGIHIDKQFWGQGYGTAATVAMLDVAFRELQAERVQLTAWSKNARAIRCFEKAGFRHEGLHRRRWWKEENWRGEVTMGILREEYERLWGDTAPTAGNDER